MTDHLKFYIDGQWVEPHGKGTREVINPATEQPIGRIAMGDATDVDRAVAAARKAFETFSRTSRDDRLALLEKILAIYKERVGDLAAAVSQEMGAPMKLANAAQVPAGIGHFMSTIRAMKDFEFEKDMGTTRVVREPIGVVGMITPWNWPLNQITCKVAPALAAGCTMVLKPSELSPINAILFAQIMDDAGVPAGVFNLVNGDGPTVGAAMSAHPGIDMMSFTGSTRAGVEVARAAAPTVKRVAQELGGKSANIVLDDADFEKVVGREMFNMCRNSGQSCNAGSRLLVPEARMDEAAAIAAAAAGKIRVGDPSDEETAMGPVSSQAQFDKIQGMLEKGVAEGARLAAGGPGRPDGLERGYFVRPTVFSHATNDMTIAREEIFGPVITIIGYKDEEDAIRIANDTPYGLSGYVSSGDLGRAQAVASRLRTGMVHLNGAPGDPNAPFGGYKQSGNGREWGEAGLEDFLETKAIMGFTPKQAKA
ncbi:MAG: aldehyde dehydrogenase family protein [Burkholderiaceae bacterium]